MISPTVRSSIPAMKIAPIVSTRPTLSLSALPTTLKVQEAVAMSKSTPLFSIAPGALEIYDVRGSNVALETAKRISNPALRDAVIENIRKYLREKTHQAFKTHYGLVLANIRDKIQISIEMMDKMRPDLRPVESITWWTTQRQTQEATVEAQSNVLKGLIDSKKSLTVACAGQENEMLRSVVKNLSDVKSVTLLETGRISPKSVDIVLAPHSLYRDMQAIFRASECLLSTDRRLPLEKHPLFPYFDMLSEDGVFIATLTSGPNIQSFTDLMLDKHELALEKANSTPDINLRIFNNVETFFRCLDIFKRRFEEVVGKTIDCELSYSMSHLPLASFCNSYISQYPELSRMHVDEREKFIRLLSAFVVGEDIVDLNLTLKMSVRDIREPKRSFKPLAQAHSAIQTKSNEISLGQLNLAHQIQNLNGSEIAMPFIKDVDGLEQFKAFGCLMRKRQITLVDIGGGRGETNAVPHALHTSGMDVSILNIEPNVPFAAPYREAYRSLGMHDVAVKSLYVHELSAQDVIEHFKEREVDGIFASHSFYFILGDLLKASLNPALPLNQHPMWKYFKMMRADGVLVATLQSGAGSRLYRNALMGKHGLDVPLLMDEDESVSLLSSFGNLATFLRYFEAFKKRFHRETGREILVKMSHSVANVPLGHFHVVRDTKTRGLMIHNPMGDDKDPSWQASKMLDFYGNWKELEASATQVEDRLKSETAIKTQETFLHILRAFAPGGVCMQHPNITLEIRVR